MNSRNPNAIWRAGGEALTGADSTAVGRRRTLIQTQVDAAAKVEEDEVLCDSGGARASEGRERKNTMEKGENEKKTGRGYL